MQWSVIRQALLGTLSPPLVPPSVKLPTLPRAVQEFVQRADDPQASPRELARIIEADTGLTCELLRFVNSPSIGLRSKASNVQYALSLLGVRAAKLFLLSTGVQSSMKSCQSKLVNFQNFWAGNLERALFARELALTLRLDADLSYSAAMLCDSLLPIVTNARLDQYLGFLQLPDSRRPALSAFEREHFGSDHALATAQIMNTWGFPDDLTCCVALHHAGTRLLNDRLLGGSAVAAVAVAALIPDPLRQTPTWAAELKKFQEARPEIDLAELAARVDDAVAELSSCPRATTLVQRFEKIGGASAVAVGS